MLNSIISIKSNTKSITLIFLSLAILTFFLFGCTGISDGAGGYRDQYLRGLKSVSINHTNEEMCVNGNCTCLVCSNGSAFFGFLTSMAGGSCHFETQCNEQTFQTLSTLTPTSTATLRQFMIGQGTDFGDFAAANTYCSNRLSMAVQWLVGGDGISYKLPDASRALCMLDRGTMPIYVLYSEGKNLEPSRVGQIAHVLGYEGGSVSRGFTSDGHVGPVIITTEIDFTASNASNPIFRQQLIDQINQIDANCQNDRTSSPPKINCFIALAPRMGDQEALDIMMRQPGVSTKVDLVAFGMNIHKSKGCNPWGLLDEARDFASYSLYTYRKPTVIPYILFDAAGTDNESSCQLNEDNLRSGYRMFFETGGAMELSQKGVIGIAPYTFYGGHSIFTNPLHCQDCDLGKTDLRRRSWFAGCAAYTKVNGTAAAGGGSRASPGAPILFSDSPAGICDYGSQLDYLFRRLQYQDTGAGRDFSAPTISGTDAPEAPLMSCSACIQRTLNPGRPIDFGTGGPGDMQRACTSFPQIERWASSRDLDPLLVRAAIQTESGFNTCSAQKVCSHEYKQLVQRGVLPPAPAEFPCFGGPTTAIDDECFGIAYDRISDAPGGDCASLLDPSINAPGTNPGETLPSNSGGRPYWRWCAFGLMQSLEPTYTYWPARYRSDATDQPNAPIFQDAYDRGMSGGIDMRGARECNPDTFNPFNPDDGLCIGTIKLGNRMQEARVEVARYHRYRWDDGSTQDLLGWAGSSGASEKDELMAAYIASSRYSGFWASRFSSNPECRGYSDGECWVREFYKSRITTCAAGPGGIGGACRGENDPIRDWPTCAGYTDVAFFIRDCQMREEWMSAAIGPIVNHRIKDRGAAKMAIYYSLRENCGASNTCPDWGPLYRNLQSAGYGRLQSIPTSGDIYYRNPSSTTSSGSR
ncbi:hypothetical protein HY990_02690 [Candidatus Micrarchaeota archaeon]|nr:hypothetical protein [Candidatus Micrarchaeota archaeon]